MPHLEAVLQICPRCCIPKAHLTTLQTFQWEPPLRQRAGNETALYVQQLLRGLFFFFKHRVTLLKIHYEGKPLQKQ